MPYQLVDLNVKVPGAREIDLFLQRIGEDDLIDTESKSYKKRGMQYMAFDASEEIASDPTLLKTPIVRDGQKVGVGVDEAYWGELAESAKG